MSIRMVRKQIYLPQRQDKVLKHMARERGISEAEVIRQALEREAESTASIPRGSVAAWDAILQFLQKRKETLVKKGKPVAWERQELYEERESRWTKSKDEE
jgi:type IV secretory pathway ATPase VirB11/archaellum biosynthesis ATPase